MMSLSDYENQNIWRKLLGAHTSTDHDNVINRKPIECRSAIIRIDANLRPDRFVKWFFSKDHLGNIRRR